MQIEKNEIFDSEISYSTGNFPPFFWTFSFEEYDFQIIATVVLNPLPLFYAFEYGLDQYFLPYEGVMFLYMFTTGCVTFRYILPIVIVRCLVAGAFVAIVAIPYWKFIGIM